MRIHLQFEVFEGFQPRPSDWIVSLINPHGFLGRGVDMGIEANCTSKIKAKIKALLHVALHRHRYRIPKVVIVHEANSELRLTGV